jgi:hypothetical protein
MVQLIECKRLYTAIIIIIKRGGRRRREAGR